MIIELSPAVGMPVALNPADSRAPGCGLLISTQGAFLHRSFPSFTVVTAREIPGAVGHCRVWRLCGPGLSSNSARLTARAMPAASLGGPLVATGE